MKYIKNFIVNQINNCTIIKLNNFNNFVFQHCVEYFAGYLKKNIKRIILSYCLF